MTIHKAKGLGFDVVLVPGLDRTTNKGDSPLLRWMLRTHAKTADRELLIAPIGSKGVESSATYQWIGGLQKQEEEAEIASPALCGRDPRKKRTASLRQVEVENE